MSTYRLSSPTLAVDTGGTPVEIQGALKGLRIVATQNYASHPRTGDDAPYEEYIDASHVVEIDYVCEYGATGINTVLEGLAGTEVDWLIETSDGVASADYPTFAFTAVVPLPSMFPGGDMGEFSEDTLSIPVKGSITKATV